MRTILSIGFPRMHKEAGEKRDFLPEFFSGLSDYDVDIYLEEGYGNGLGYTEKDYLKSNAGIKFTSAYDVYMKDIVVILRCPETTEIDLMKEGSILISMLHYETRETRNKLLSERKINCFSMDAMCNDENERIMVNYKGTSRAGSRIAFEELKKRTDGFNNVDGKIINISIIGLGSVAANSAKAFEELSDREFLDEENGIGVIIHMLPRTITQNCENLKKILEVSDILVDASKRPDPSKVIVSNRLIKYLPEHSVILDLTADPYNDKILPMQVKGIEGIPTGTLDKYVIETDDELYDTIPGAVLSDNRRLVVSCNAWPGVDAKDCMLLYGRQLIPFLDVILNKGIKDLDVSSKNMYERSLIRSSLAYYVKNKNNRSGVIKCLE